jgi:hypothetical protein
VFIVYMAVCEQKTGAFFFDPPRRGWNNPQFYVHMVDAGAV